MLKAKWRGGAVTAWVTLVVQDMGYTFRTGVEEENEDDVGEGGPPGSDMVTGGL